MGFNINFGSFMPKFGQTPKKVQPATALYAKPAAPKRVDSEDGYTCQPQFGGLDNTRKIVPRDNNERPIPRPDK